MLKAIRQFFSPPVFPDDEEKTRQARILYILLTSTFIFITLCAFAILFVFAEKIVNGILISILLVSTLINFAVAHRGHVRLSSFLFLVPIWVVFTVALLLIGRITTAATCLFIALAVVTGILLGMRYAILSATLISTVGLGLALLENANYPLIHYFPVPPLASWVDFSIALFMTVTPLFLTLQSSAHALARARKSERRYATLFQEAPMMYLTLREEGGAPIISDCNAACLATMKYAREQVVGQNLARFYSTKSRSALLEEGGFQNALHDEVKAPIERELITQDGQTIPVMIRVAPDVDETGQTVGVLAMGLDISESKRVAAALQESEGKFRALFDRAGYALGMAKAGITVMVNPAYLDLFGYHDPSEVIGNPLLNDIAPEEHPRLKEYILRRTRGELAPSSYETKGIRKDGSIFDMDIKVSTYELDGGIYTIGILRDISEQKRSQEKITHDVERSKALARIATRLNASFGLDEVLRAVCEEIALALDAPVAIIWLIDEKKEYYLPRAAYGVPPQLYEGLQPTPYGIHSMWREIEENIFLVEDAQRNPEPNSVYSKILEMNSGVNCLFSHERQLIGNLSVYRKERGWQFSDVEITLLKTLINQIAIAIHHANLYEQVKSGRERLQILSEKLVDIQEEERRHLALELHDEIGQRLTHVKMELDRFDPAHPQEGKLEQARGMIIDLMNQIRNLSLELRPTILDDLGLLPAVLWHIERFTSMTGIPIDCKHNGVNRRFRMQIESTVYRILQESLTNIARHAAASRVTVSLWADEERLGLQVEDNGVGFDLASALHKITGGLSGMRERANICGGQLQIESNLGKGTYISLELPLQDEYLERRTP